MSQSLRQPTLPDDQPVPPPFDWPLTAEYGSHLLDLPAYLRRIGYDGELAPSLPVLRAVHRAHLGAITFENLDVQLGREVLLDVPSLQRKLVDAERGGYCYEQNLLLLAALDRIGFDVRPQLGRIRGGSDVVRWRSHTTLRVRLDGRLWLADVGYGGGGITEPVLMAEGPLTRQGEWTYRMVREPGDVWVLQTLRADGWWDAYSMTTERQYLVDFEAANYVTSHRPNSPFVKNILVQRTFPDHRLTLRGTELTTGRPDGVAETRTVTLDELPGLLRDTFNLRLSDAELDQLRTVAAGS